MIFREALLQDIDQIQTVRHSVRENVLSDPRLVTNEACAEFIINRGKGWVCEIDERIVGFAITDLVEKNIWALFVHPLYENQGIGKKLHQVMLEWYFAQNQESVWLSTSPGTRAELFYRKHGWKEEGVYGKNEIKFVLTNSQWNANQ